MYYRGQEPTCDSIAQVIIIFITAEKGGVATAMGEGEKEKECTAEGKSRRRRDEKAPWGF